MQISIAAEEIFVNIANYAYAPEIGKASVRVEITEDPITVCITFMDGGKPFDPTKKSILYYLCLRLFLLIISFTNGRKLSSSPAIKAPFLNA